MKKAFVRKSIVEEIKQGELIRIIETGETFIFHSAAYQCNWSCGVTIFNRRMGEVYIGQMNIADICIVDKFGHVSKRWINDLPCD